MIIFDVSPESVKVHHGPAPGPGDWGHPSIAAMSLVGARRFRRACWWAALRQHIRQSKGPHRSRPAFHAPSIVQHAATPPPAEARHA